MRGFIDKREKGWFVKYVALSNHDVGTIIKELPSCGLDCIPI